MAVAVQRVPEEYLEELCRIIKDSVKGGEEDDADQNVMAALRKAKISASQIPQ